MKEILKNLDIDTIIPHGGGIESAAAVAWAKRLGLKPLLLSLDMGDVPKVRHTIEAVKKQAKHFNVPLHIERNTIPMTKLDVPPGDFFLDMCTRLVLGNPQWNIKYVVFGANSEDSMNQRMTLRNFQRILAGRWGLQYDLHGMQFGLFKKIPQIVFPFEYLTKSEIIGIMATHDKEVLSMIWTCTNPINGKPCRQCHKCIEYAAAKNTARRAKKKIQEGETYGHGLQDM